MMTLINSRGNAFRSTRRLVRSRHRRAKRPSVSLQAGRVFSALPVQIRTGSHRNRSPIADPKSKGVFCGLTLDTSQKQLAILYLAALQGIAYGTRHIVEHCNSHGHKITTVLACGGLAKNRLFVQEHADIIGCPIILPRESESVLLGASILGAVASKKYTSLHDAMKAMNAPGQVIQPSEDANVKKYHNAKYRIFRELYQQQLSHRSIMAEALG